MPKISIIVPIYNVYGYVADCLESLINQTMPDIEIICIDDRGTDDSMSVVRKYATRDSRIKIIRNWRNRGLSFSRNHGIKHARAPYIMFCDSDDIFMTDACEKMYNAITETRADVAVGNVRVIYEANHELQDSDTAFFSIPRIGCFEIPSHIKGICYGSAWGKIYRHDIIVNNKLRFPVGLKHEDEFFWPAFCSVSKRITFIGDVVYSYRRRAGSIMNIAYQQNRLNTDPIKISIQYFKWTRKHNVFWEQRNWFWGVMFPGMLAAAIKYSGIKNKNKCMRIAIRFINHNWSPFRIDENVQKSIAKIINQAKKMS